LFRIFRLPRNYFLSEIPNPMQSRSWFATPLGEISKWRRKTSIF
jgi:hypothetical protein